MRKYDLSVMGDAYKVEPNAREKLSDNFYRDEFACPHCGVADLDPRLVLKLQELRSTIGRSLVITSGYRCQDQNDTIPHSSKRSSHIKGLAVDIACGNSIDRYELVALSMKAFKRVGIYSGWIHVDIDESADKLQNVMWVG